MHPADRYPRLTAGPAERTRANLEERLLPLVRRALRSRTGLPALVGWVDRSLAVLTVTLDNPKDAETRKKVEALLARLKPAFRTVNLDVDPNKRWPNCTEMLLALEGMNSDEAAEEDRFHSMIQDSRNTPTEIMNSCSALT